MERSDWEIKSTMHPIDSLWIATKTLDTFQPKILGNKESEMGKGQRFTEEFRVEAVKQVTERGFAVKDVSKRLGVSP